MKDEALISAGGVVAIAEAIARRDVSPVEVAEAFLARIEAFDSRLGAFVAIEHELVLEQARAREVDVMRGAILGPLHGIPIGVKDNIAVAGEVLTAGSAFRRGCRARRDAPTVSRLRRAGAVMAGKSNMHEWAIGATGVNPHLGTTHNAWRWGHIAGGSSSGSATAVAAGLLPGSLGTDTGGSVRIPAALNGVCGLRPTVGSVSTAGVIPMSWSLDTIGPVARTVVDLESLHRVLVGLPTPAPDQPADADEATGVRLLVVANAFDHCDQLVERRVLEACEVLSQLGGHVETTRLPGLAFAGWAASRLALAEAAAYHERRMIRQPHLFGRDVRARLVEGRDVSATTLARVFKYQREWRRVLAGLLDSPATFLVLPAVPFVAPSIAASDAVTTTRELTCSNYPISLAGMPSLVIPCGFVDGLPVGMQAVAACGREPDLLALGRLYQAATSWHQSLPRSGPR